MQRSCNAYSVQFNFKNSSNLRSIICILYFNAHCLVNIMCTGLALNVHVLCWICVSCKFYEHIFTQM